MFEHNFQRRRLIQGLGAGALAASLGGCAKTSTAQVKRRFQRPFSRNPMVAPKISHKSIMNQIVGHRPYRPEGFVVRSEAFGQKVLVHNYGHGGGGITLSWGSSALAVNEVNSLKPKQAAIIGSGVMGLTTARLLQQAGWQVTIYTKELAQHTTSQVAGGEWGPYSVHDPLVSSDGFKQQLHLAAKVAHQTFSRMVGAEYGVQWMELYSASDEPPKAHDEFAEFYPFKQHYGVGQHPFNSEYCSVSTTLLVETSTFLRRLIQDIYIAGGHFVIRNFENQEALLSLAEPVIFNCTGLGSRALFNDEGIMPAKGQLILLPPDPAVDYLTVGGGSDSLYMFSRHDYMILGGTFSLNDWSTEPDPEQTDRIITESQQFFANVPR